MELVVCKVSPNLLNEIGFDDNFLLFFVILCRVISLVHTVTANIVHTELTQLFVGEESTEIGLKGSSARVTLVLRKKRLNIYFSSPFLQVLLFGSFAVEFLIKDVLHLVEVYQITIQQVSLHELIVHIEALFNHKEVLSFCIANNFSILLFLLTDVLFQYHSLVAVEVHERCLLPQNL